MKYGFLNIRALSPRVIPGRPLANARALGDLARAEGAHVTLFPELSLTGCTAGDLYFRASFIDEALDALTPLAEAARGLVFVGLPVRLGGRVYNCMAALANGHILGLIPKPRAERGQYAMEARWFADGADERARTARVGGEEVPFGADLVFEESSSGTRLCVCFASAVRAGDTPPRADIILCPDAAPYSPETDGYAHDILSAESRRRLCAIAYANAGEGESTAEGVFEGETYVFQGGEECASAELACVDIERLGNLNLARALESERERPVICFNMNWKSAEVLPARVSPTPFLDAYAGARLSKIVRLQARALAERLTRAGIGKPIVGVSGGLDSTLTLIAASEAVKLMGNPPSHLIAVTMPGFGTGELTRSNADKLMRALNADIRVIPITEACRAHLNQIGHDARTPDVTYENAQARERTQILMDLANKEGALVVGTGDLSELALGFCTYNGDHMSMYAVNASLPKTLIREIVKRYGDEHAELKEVLYAIVSTPISPELKPASAEGDITQKTEEIIGKYELNDFFMYHLLVNNFSKYKVEKLARIAFERAYGDEAIQEAMARFEKRFFSQQYKRACAPDGPKLGPLSFSPRGGFMLPSDVSAEF